MRLVILTLLGLVLARDARGESAPLTPPDASVPLEPATPSGSGVQKVDDDPRKIDPSTLMRERQQIELAGGGGRSGFWTSRKPAKGGAYRWRMLGIGLGLIVITGVVIVIMIRRANRANAARKK